MIKTESRWFLYAALTVCLSAGGCGTSENSGAESTGELVIDDLPDLGMAPDEGHPEHGPHGGDLIELGKEAFHGELVHEESGASIYILDGSARESVAIEAEKLVVSLKHDGSVQSFDLPMNRQPEDPNEKSSRFTSSDENLHTLLDAGAEGAVTIAIDGKSYTGKVSHDHDHSGHDH